MEQNIKKYAHEAILHGLRLAFGAALLDDLRAALSRITDWNYLLQTALDQGVFPSLYRQVADNCPEVVPPKVLVKWQRLYKAHAQRNLKITRGLIQVLNLLADNGIIAVSYKGPLLAAVAYGDIAFRQFVDLDILVSGKDIGRVRDLLSSQGYRLSYSLTTKQERAHLHGAVEYTFAHPQRAILDVHWRFAADYLGVGPNPEEAIARRMAVKILEKTVYTLDPEDKPPRGLSQRGLAHVVKAGVNKRLGPPDQGAGRVGLARVIEPSQRVRYAPPSAAGALTGSESSRCAGARRNHEGG